MDILSKIKRANLVGRGGAGFFVGRKWTAVALALADKEAGERKCYVVCNAAEGEPGVIKDGYILEHFADKVIAGMKIAIDFLLAEKGYLFLNHIYYNKLNKKLAVLIKELPIEIFVKPFGAGYVGGEESAVLNAIEGKRIEPRLKPPYATTNGLWGQPTLINNVETFYNVSLVSTDQFTDKRFYTITGDCPYEGVYELPAGLTIAKVLEQTKNYPKFPFFVQIGGLASGQVLNSAQLKRQVSGVGSIAVYSLAKTNFKKIIKIWLDFFINESCGQCVPCREGVYRLKDAMLTEKSDRVLINELLDNLSNTSFCAFGASVPVPIKSLIKNVYTTNG